jgi:cytochrome o ubiquinol oxidase subunit 2
MRFKFRGLSRQGFDQWVATVREKGTALNRDAYLKLEKPSAREPVHYYASADKGLFDAILNLCATPGKMCVKEMMHIDMTGGAGKESQENYEKLKYDDRFLKEDVKTPGATFPATGNPAFSKEKPKGADKDQPSGHDMHDMNGMENMPGMDHGKTDAAPNQISK